MSRLNCNDYDGRCGNCHSIMEASDKYCKYCGTPKGQGEFKPYDNRAYMVYGPPINQLYTCQECGHKWLHKGLGRDNAEFCPDCRSKHLDIKTKYTWQTFDETYFADDYSEELKEGYRYLSENEVRRLIYIRSEIDRKIIEGKIRIHDSYPLQDKLKRKQAELLSKNGFPEWHEAYDGEIKLTESMAGRANLEKLIITNTSGTDPTAMKQICPCCKGSMIAGILYHKNDILGDKEFLYLDYTDDTGEGVYCDSELKRKEGDMAPLYKCLQCGFKFDNGIKGTGKDSSSHNKSADSLNISELTQFFKKLNNKKNK